MFDMSKYSFDIRKTYGFSARFFQKKARLSVVGQPLREDGVGTDYFLRRRAASAASASRLSVAVAGSGMATRFQVSLSEILMPEADSRYTLPYFSLVV